MASKALPRQGDAAPGPASDATHDVAQLPVANPGLLIVGIMAASLLQVLDTTIANVAIPHMRTALSATTETITWVLTSYIIASAVALPITGWLADRVGARRLFILSVAGFILSSMLCGMAQNLGEMVAFRALQGVTGAFIAPLSQAFMLDTNKPSRHAQMMALWGMGIMIGPILGPVLGGWLTEQANWRWVFYVNLPIGILSLAILVTQLPQRETVRRRFDIGGFLLVGIALASFQMLLDRGQTLDWYDSYEIWLWTFLFVSTAWMAVIHLGGAREPLFDRALFLDRNFAIALGFMLAIGVVMFATMALLPPMLQQLMSYDVIDTGLVLMPRGIGVLISMQFAGMAVRRGIDARPVVATGFAICALSLWQMSHWSLGVDRFHIVYSGLIQGLGMGLVFIPLNVSAFATLPARLRTDGSSLMNLFRSLGASAGISLTTVMLARNLQTSHADIASNITGASVSSVVDVSTVDRYQNLGEVALRMLDLEANRQAAMIAYVDDFRMMMWITLAAIPLAFIMKRNSRPQASLPPPGD